MSSEMVCFTKENAKEFDAAIAKAKTAGQEVFSFEGHEYFVSFAEYLSEYINDRLNHR